MPTTIVWGPEYGWVDSDAAARHEYDPHGADTVAIAYAVGAAGVGRHWTDHRTVRDACASWRAAQGDHGHTSYWGVPAIRRSRAYFVGLRRYWRAQGYRC